ncbi:MAG: tRNA (adenosine(37)-N6)-threonylcarbamoyltransferase complex dimerization subunit type 1 TsaB [Candidatus Hydrogenedentota bacterium]
MRILAADTATAYNTVALVDDGGLLAETVVRAGRRHSERLVATVDWVLSEAGCALKDVDLLAISIGPGSFTGLRVGASAWKGLALAANLPLIGVPTLAAMTRVTAFSDEIVVPLLDARMSEVFGAVFSFVAGHRSRLTEDRVCPVSSILENVPPGAAFFGDGAELYRAAITQRVDRARFLPPEFNAPRAGAVAAEARELFAAGAIADPDAIAPVYLRDSQPEEARKAVSGP